jgi:hypothetical protein
MKVTGRDGRDGREGKGREGKGREGKGGDKLNFLLTLPCSIQCSAYWDLLSRSGAKNG